MCRLILAITIAGIVYIGQVQPIAEGPLPLPVRTSNPVELCLNSRYSQHSLARGEPALQHISNILWAASSAPMLGSYRRVFVYTSLGSYLYDPNGHRLDRFSSEPTREGTFSIGYQADQVFDAGVSYMLALLASVSLSNSPLPSIASCPKGLGLPSTRLYFGIQPVATLTSQLVVRCSLPQDQAGWLPDPCTSGGLALEPVLARLNYTRHLVDAALTSQQISQLLWAGYGCTAHYTSNARAGLTVPSAYASYYLTGRVYLVAADDLLYRYMNRNPGTNLASRDHRLELVDRPSRTRLEMAGLADIRSSLREAVPDLPQASCYLILCLDKSNAAQEFAMLEVGFVAANVLVQASAMGLGCHFSLVTGSRQAAVQTATGIPTSDLPQVVIGIGHILKGDTDLDGIVDLHDMAILASSWHLAWGQGGYDPRADMDRDGEVDIADLALITDGWLTTVRR